MDLCSECAEHHCPDFKSKLDACTKRVTEEGAEETCVEEFFDLMVRDCF